MKVCKRCNQKKPLTEFWKNKTTRDGLQLYCKDCVRKYNKESYRRHPSRHIAKAKIQQQLLKREILTAYGGECACCGEADFTFLVIDHIGGGGRKQRDEEFNGFGGACSYRWLRREGFPSGFRVLCHNCNWATAFNRTCPHQEMSI